MKTFLILVVLFFSSSVVAEKIMLYCSDIKVGGFEGESNYSELKNYAESKFKVKLDLGNKTIVSNDLMMEAPECGYFPKVSEEFSDFLYCIHDGISFTLNLEDYRFTRTRGFGFAIGKKDDIGIAYGTCEQF